MPNLIGGGTGIVDADSVDATFSCLASSHRRNLIQGLIESTQEAVSREELTTLLTACTDGASRGGMTDIDSQDGAIELHHQHLPSLIEAGLVAYDVENEVVTLTDHPALQDQGILEAVGSDDPARSESLDALFRALADTNRRTILDVLSHQFDAIHIVTLARELEARKRNVAESNVPTAAVEKMLISLRHVHLPHLAETGLIEYDAAAGAVAYTGHPMLRVPWMHSVFQPAFRGSLTGESEPDGIGEIEGREQVVSFGQSLLESADEELFCMFTDTQLLMAGCLARIRDAARERDVDVYLGTRDPTVRQYVEENAPDIIVWEPDTNWLNLPVTGDRVGRLLMADRKAVMLGTLTEKQSDGLYEEKAIIGEGDHNTLVTMISQLLGPHLEAIDSDTDNIGTHIPL